MPRFVVEITLRARAADGERGVPDLTWVGGADDNTAAADKAYDVWEQRFGIKCPLNARVRVAQLDG
jgi:hypothetical protein